MRLHLRDAGVGEVDAVVWTHEHADHTHGLDDLRQIMHLRRGSPVPAYAREHVLETLKWRFAYAFAGNAGYPASVDPIELRDHQAIGPIEVRSEAHTSELQSLMRISYAVFCLKKNT